MKQRPHTILKIKSDFKFLPTLKLFLKGNSRIEEAVENCRFWGSDEKMLEQIIKYISYYLPSVFFGFWDIFSHVLRISYISEKGSTWGRQSVIWEINLFLDQSPSGISTNQKKYWLRRGVGLIFFLKNWNIVTH